jgi:hypothetical protein
MKEEWIEVKSESNIWLPEEKNSTIQGVVINVEKGQYGLQLAIETMPGVVIWTPSHKALQCRLVHFVPGDWVKIVYLGADLPKVKGQQGTRLYQVFKKAEVQCGK